MDEKMVKPTWLRIVAAVILGGIIGLFLFLLVALIIGAINGFMGMNIPINLQMAENIWSPVLLIIFIGFSIAGLWWKVETTPPEEAEIPISEKMDE
jgi:branched-subunit amino acid ABC-type transport system permease component